MSQELVTTTEQSQETPPTPPSLDSADADQKLATLLYVCEDTRHWIIQADTKGGFLLTINGVVAGFMLPQALSILTLWRKPLVSMWILLILSVVLALYAGWQLYAFWQTAQVFVPRTPGMDHSARSRHVFNLSLSQHFPRLEDGQRLREEYHTLTPDDLELEYLSQLHVDAIVCSAKYRAFRVAFRHLLITLALAASSYLLILLLTSR